MAKASRSSCGYLDSTWVVALLANAMGLAFSILSPWHNIADMPVWWASTKTYVAFSGSKCLMSVSSLSSFRSASNSLSHSAVYLKRWCLFVSCRRFAVFVAKLGMNSLLLCIIQRNDSTSSLFWGGDASWRALTLSGSGLIHNAPPGGPFLANYAFIQV